MDKPILFSAEMIKAIDEDRKNRTRRVIKKIPCECGNWIPCEVSNTTKEGYQASGHSGLWSCESCMSEPAKSPYIVGETRWIQETWKIDRIDYDGFSILISYKAGGKNTVQFSKERYFKFRKFSLKGGWQSPYFMPREAARSFIEITDVKPERLQDITEEDAKAEGVSPIVDAHLNILPNGYRLAFSDLWNKLNLKRGYGYDMNPWIRVISFEKVNTK
jgi:hypothetical protein